MWPAARFMLPRCRALVSIWLGPPSFSSGLRGSRLICRQRYAMRICGFVRVIQSPKPDLVWPACARVQTEMETTTSLMAPKYGPPARSLRTGFFVWCVPMIKSSSSAVSVSYLWIWPVRALPLNPCTRLTVSDCGTESFLKMFACPFSSAWARRIRAGPWPKACWEMSA